jgi:hypothetical protein
MALPDATPGVLEIASGREEAPDEIVRRAQEFFSRQERMREQIHSR